MVSLVVPQLFVAVKLIVFIPGVNCNLKSAIFVFKLYIVDTMFPFNLAMIFSFEVMFSILALKVNADNVTKALF